MAGNETSLVFQKGSLLRIRPAAAAAGPVRRGGGTCLLQDPQAVQLAGRLDDPMQ